MIRKRLTAVLAMAGSTALLAVAQPAAAGNIKRSCNAYYIMHISVASKTDGTKFFNIAGTQWSPVRLRLKNPTGPISAKDDLHASGGCGQTVPNRCRRRARDKLRKCAQDQFANLNSKPASCNTVSNYPAGNGLKKAIEKNVCARVQETHVKITYQSVPRNYTVRVIPQMKIYGNTGCKSVVQVSEAVIQCSH